MSILIDPYMFELSDIHEIENNISFFFKLIKLCTKQKNEQRMHIVLYQGIVDKICKREIQPFPIDFQEISDPDLRTTIMQINNSFNHLLFESIVGIDIDDCSGAQEFVIHDEDGIAKDDNYYEMFCTLLIPCYSQNVHIDDRILTGIKKDGKHIGDKFEIECNCTKYHYSKKCVFSGIEEFISEKEKAIELLREKRKKGEIVTVDSVIAELGDHHNHVQADGKKFSSLKELSYKNKRVLKLFQELGLYKIIFGRFTSKGVKETGTMRIYCVKECDTQDIIEVKFHAETGFQLLTELYFPKGIGQLLYDYFKTDTLMYQNVSELLEKI